MSKQENRTLAESKEESVEAPALNPVKRGARRGLVSLSQAHPELEAEWDYEKNGDLLPTEVSSGSSKKVWWLCAKCGHSWEAYINNRANKGSGCPVCAGRVPKQGVNDVATLYPELMLDWDYEANENLDPTTLMRTNSSRVYWKCHVCGNQWVSSLVTRTLHDTGCPVCRDRERAEKGNLLAIRYPDVASEWNFARNVGIDIMTVAQYSDMSVWWRCRECGHEFQARVRNRTNGHTGCPKCASQKNVRQSVKSFSEQGFPLRIGVTYDKETQDVFSGLGRCGLIHVYELEQDWDRTRMGLAGEGGSSAAGSASAHVPSASGAAAASAASPATAVQTPQVPRIKLVEQIDTTGMKREGIMRTLEIKRITHFITGELGGNAMLSLASTATLCFYNVSGNAERRIKDLLVGKLQGKFLERAKVRKV